MNKEKDTHGTIDEEYFKQIIANSTSKYVQPDKTEKVCNKEEGDGTVNQTDLERKSVKKKRNLNTDEYETVFLKQNILRDRKQVYIGRDTYDRLTKYLGVIAGRKLGIMGYLDNIVSHHIRSHKTEIGELFRDRIGNSLDLD